MNEKLKIAKIQLSQDQVRLIITPIDMVLVIPLEVHYSLKLVENVIITESQFERLKSESELFHCDKEAVRMLGRRNHSSYELKEKLKRKEFESGSVDKVVSKYKKQGVINDLEHALKLGNTLISRKPCGKPYMSSYLFSKKVSKSVSDEVVTMIYESENLLQLAILALENKWNSLLKDDLESTKNKAYNYLSRRGFDYGTSKEAFEQMLENHEVVFVDNEDTNEEELEN